MTRNGYYVVLDFDGTVVKHRYPAVGEDIGAVPVLRKLVQNGHDLLLSTMRSRDSEGDQAQYHTKERKERYCQETWRKGKNG